MRSSLFFFLVLSLGLAACGGQHDRDPDDQLPGGDTSLGDGDGAGDGDGDSAGDGTGDGVGDGDEPLPGDGDGEDPSGDYEVVTCSGWSAPAAGCTASGAGADLALVGTVLTPGHVYEGGIVRLTSNGLISCVGCDCTTDGARVVTCGDAVISPGLINAHDHIGWMSGRPYVASNPALRYEHRHDWRKGDAADGEQAISTPGGANNDEKAWGELRFVLGGATSINGSGDAPGLLRNLDRTSGMEGLTGGTVHYETFPLGDSSGGKRTSDCSYPDIDNPATVQAKRAYTPHVAEGIEEAARNELLCLTSTARGGREVLAQNAAIIHGVGLDAVDVTILANLGGKLIWSPRSNVSLYGDTAPVTLYHALDVPIALGTDWVPSGSMNMNRELACARELNERNFGGYFSDQDLWRMVTVDAAAALGFTGTLGRLASGHAGDVAVYSAAGRGPFEAVVSAEPQDALLVLRGGEVLAGEAELVAALEQGCDTVSVCGTSKRVCVQREVGKSFAQLEAAGGANYPLFFCGTPEDEPSCLPSRGALEVKEGSSSYSGTPSATDQDGDGLIDENDNCPTIWNPIRPVDFGAQPDADSDGLGDVCDRCPLDDGEACAAADPNDLDGDGVANAADNCPTTVNTDQTDGDGDGKGDACDGCPAAANPGDASCPATPYDVKLGLIAEGARVAMSGLVVTAHTSNGFFAQLSPDAPTYDATHGPLYSGLFVFVGSAALPDLGSTVEVTSATVTLYWGVLELTQTTWQPASTQLALPTPVSVSEAQVLGDGQTPYSGDSPYEGVLVHLAGVTVGSTAPAPGDGDTAQNELELDGGLRVDDLAGYALDPMPSVGATLSKLDGVVAWRNGYLKVLPRSASDVVVAVPGLVGFSRASSFMREGATAAVEGPLTLVLGAPAPSALSITIDSTDPTVAQVSGGAVSVASGATQVDVPLLAGAASASPVQLTASYDGTTVSTSVRVIANDTPALLVGLSPQPLRVIVGTAATLTVELDVPAPVGGASISLVASGSGSFGQLDVGSLIVPHDARTATFTFTAGATPGTGTISATLGTDTLTTNVVIEAAAMALDGWSVTQTSSTATLELPGGTTVSAGDYVIIARDADRSAFETFWGVSLGANVVFLNAKGALPLINGAETFSVYDESRQLIDGPTLAMVEKKCYARTAPDGDAGQSSSWTLSDATDKSNAKPGAGAVSTGSGLYVSEICDAVGTGNYVYEFVELYFAGM